MNIAAKMTFIMNHPPGAASIGGLLVFLRPQRGTAPLQPALASSARLIMQGLGATAIAKTLGIGRASVYRVLEVRH